MISFDININNIFSKKYCKNDTLSFSYFLPFIDSDIKLSKNQIKKEIIFFIKKQKYFLKKSQKHPSDSIFFFCTEPSYDYLINLYLPFFKENISNELNLNVEFYLTCFKNDSVHNIDHFFDYFIEHIEVDWNFFDNYEIEREKKFITLNNRKRQHRIDLKNFLNDNNILKDSFYSFNWENNFNFNNNIVNNNFNFRDVRQYYFLLKHLTLKKIKHYFINDDLWTNLEMIQLFKKSLFYIITERDYSNNCIFPTEKIYKSFLYKIPFILIGNPGTLNYLKQKGFKTFFPFINESYDNELNYQKRKKMIYDEILRLNSINLKNLYIDCNDIMKYNYNLLKEKKNEIHSSRQ